MTVSNIPSQSLLVSAQWKTTDHTSNFQPSSFRSLTFDYILSLQVGKHDSLPNHYQLISSLPQVSSNMAWAGTTFTGSMSPPVSNLRHQRWVLCFFEFLYKFARHMGPSSDIGSHIASKTTKNCRRTRTKTKKTSCNKKQTKEKTTNDNHKY